MTKEEFILELNKRLDGNPDRDEMVSYYYELLSDRVDAGEPEEMVFTQAELDDILASVAHELAGVPIVSTIKEEKQEEALEIEKNDGPRELSGGRLFWYTIWRIATVCFCILAVCTEVCSVCIIVGGGAFMASSAQAFKESVGLGIVLVGVGLVILGAGIVGGYYANFLRKYMFSHRIGWNETIYTKLGGRR